MERLRCIRQDHHHNKSVVGCHFSFSSPRSPFNLRQRNRIHRNAYSNSRYLTQFSWNFSVRQRKTQHRKMKWKKKLVADLSHSHFVKIPMFICFLFWSCFDASDIGRSIFTPYSSLSFYPSRSNDKRLCSLLALIVKTFSFIHSFHSVIHDIYIVSTSNATKTFLIYELRRCTGFSRLAVATVHAEPIGNIYLNVAT